MLHCNFAFLVNCDGYKKYTYLAAESAGASVPQLGDRVSQWLFRIHNAEPLNRYFELPFKKIWFKKVVDESKLDKDGEVFFVLYESFHMSYSRRLIQYYKKKYKQSKFIFLFSNPAGEYNLHRLGKIKDLLDGVFSFIKEDAEKYGFHFLEEDPFLLPTQKKYSEETDLFFVGADKGRLPVLLKIFDRLHSEGGVCDFWITDVPAEKQKYADVIHYNQHLTYEEVLQHDAKTRCILEVLQDGKSYSSIRTMEALQYHKKLLTMSDTVKNLWFYNPEIIQVFHQPEEISVAFIRSKVNEKNYENTDIGSFERFKSNIIKCMKDSGRQ